MSGSDQEAVRSGRAFFRVGVDLGGTKSECILLDPTGAELFRLRRPTPRDQGYQAILENIHGLVRDTVNRIPVRDAPWGVGIGIPGMVDESSGLVRNANTTELIGRPLRKDLTTLIGRPVVLENDANCFTLAECRAGAARGHDFVFGVIMGTGCGGGLFANGRVRHGPHGIAGEWGHASIDPEGAVCYCGKRGCIETKISGSGVERAFRDAFGAKYDSPFTMADILAGYRKGNPDCALVFSQFLDDFGRALGGLISILDPDLVVLGGGLSNIDELYDLGIARVREHAFHEDLRTPIVRNELGDSAGVLGAAWLAE